MVDKLDTEVKKLGDFTKIGNGSLKLENEKQKIVVLGRKNANGTVLPMHYLLQLPNGKWIGKLGAEGPTIIHDDIDILVGRPGAGGYGEIIAVYSRANGTYKKK